MTMPDMIFEEARKDAQLRALLKTFMERSGLDDLFEFLYTSDDNNQNLYNRFIRSGAPMEVNIDGAQKDPLDKLAGAGQWDQMDDGIKAARKFLIKTLQDDVKLKFGRSDEYRRWLVQKTKKPTPEGVLAVKTLTKLLKSSKDAAKLTPLMVMVQGGRAASDRKEAYEAMGALLKDKSKLPAAFTSAKITIPK
jgi:hypothetical protein